MNTLIDNIEKLKKNEKYGERERQLLDNFAAAEPIEFTVTLDGQPLKVTGWEGIVYETAPIPVDTERTFGMGRSDDPYGWYKLSLWVPENAPENAPIIYRVRNGGWHNFALSKERPFVAHGGTYSSTDSHDSVGKALSMGYAIVESGARGRMLSSQDGRHIGKAPAVIVDTKAAIRFLRLIDPLIKPSAEKIVVTGTSGGGALSVITAASGNADEFNDLLLKAGAAGIDDSGSSFIRDDVFGTIAYCPIIDLGHADMAYAWQYQQTRQDQNEKKPGTWSEETLRASKELAGRFGDYVASLGLKNDGGEPITISTI